MSQDDPWIDELERDLGQPARLRLIANAGGQRRNIPIPRNAATSRLAGEVGADVIVWLAERFGGEAIEVPSAQGRAREERANLLRAAVLEAGLDAPTRSTNALASEFHVSSTWIRRVRSQLKAERARALPLYRS